MFLNFDLLGDSLSQAEKEEQEQVQEESTYKRVLAAEDLSELVDVSTELLAKIMLNMDDYVRDICDSSQVVGKVFTGVRQAKRVATARLL